MNNNAKYSKPGGIPPRVVIWGTGQRYNEFRQRIRCAVDLGEMNVIGVTSDDNWYRSLDGFRFIPKLELMAVPFDYVLVAESGTAFQKARQEYASLGGEREKLLVIDVLNASGFTFPQYVELYRSKLTIIANECWGGLTYHRLHLEFRTPLINMFELDEEYLDLLRDFDRRIKLPLEYVRDEHEAIHDIDYPVFSLGGTLLHMNHYPDRAQAIAQWKARVPRINYENRLWVMVTERQDMAEQFEELPYEKKVCFTSFPTDLPSAMYVKPYGVCTEHLGRGLFWERINGMASEKYPFYDVYELLVHGRKCYRAES